MEYFTSETIGIEDLLRNLSDDSEGDTTWLTNYRKFSIGRGDTLFVPVGTVALITSVDNPNEHNSSWHIEDACAIVMHYITTDVSDVQDVSVRNEIIGLVRAAVTRRMKALKEGTAILTRWLERNQPNDADAD